MYAIAICFATNNLAKLKPMYLIQARLDCWKNVVTSPKDAILMAPSKYTFFCRFQEFYGLVVHVMSFPRAHIVYLSVCGWQTCCLLSLKVFFQFRKQFSSLVQLKLEMIAWCIWIGSIDSWLHAQQTTQLLRIRTIFYAETYLVVRCNLLKSNEALIWLLWQFLHQPEGQVSNTQTLAIKRNKKNDVWHTHILHEYSALHCTPLVSFSAILTLILNHKSVHTRTCWSLEIGLFAGTKATHCKTASSRHYTLQYWTHEGFAAAFCVCYCSSKRVLHTKVVCIFCSVLWPWTYWKHIWCQSRRLASAHVLAHNPSFHTHNKRIARLSRAPQAR